MYESPVSLTLGFHGCDRDVGESLLAGRIPHLRKSESVYDWLGHGVYIWENNPERALQFAKELRDHPRKNKPLIKEPFVIGAVIDPGNCLNLVEARSLRLVREAYSALRAISDAAGRPLPRNKRDAAGALLRRDLDCAVIETLHQTNSTIPYDTVRGLFIEGEPIYENAGFHEKNHVQICVRSMSSIRGYFRPIPE